MAEVGKHSKIVGYPLLAEAAKLVESGKLDQAAQRIMTHLRQHRNEPRGLSQLGNIAIQLGALGQAERFLRLALAHGASKSEINRNLASVLNQQERLEEAYAMFDKLQQEDDDPVFSAIISVILDKLGRYEEAKDVRQKLVEQHPDKPHFWIAYGHSLRSAGCVDEAIKAYRTAAKADFECGEAWWGLASIKTPILTDDDIAMMRKALTVAIDIRNSAPTHFALARAFHDREDYAKAFEHYSIGNQQRADSIGYDARELSEEVTEIEKLVDAGYMANLERKATDEDKPVFIVSLPRSGSTLLEQMLGSHPEIEPIGELPYVPAILRSVMEMATRQGNVTVPQLIAGINPDQAAAMGKDYLRRAKLHRKTDRRYFVDKLPHNWSNVLFIRAILPQAQFVDIRRSPMDCCFSNFTQSFSSAHASSFALKDIGQCYTDYIRYMNHLDAVAPDMIHHVRYESLVENAEVELRKVLEYLGLGWDETVLDFHKLNRVVRTPSSEQVRRPLNRDGMNVWKPYSQWLEPLRDVLGPLSG